MIEKEYERWLAKAIADPYLIPELAVMTEEQKYDAFYRSLEFGTAGLRGVIGAGTNRMNLYVVARASAGLAAYLAESAGSGASVVIGYDSRIKSEYFARAAAAVFAACGLKVHLWPQLAPVPCVSFAVRDLKADAGVMITASHNPSKYNGYKVYGPDGCQMTTEAAGAVLEKIEALDVFDVPLGNYDEALKAGQICLIEPAVMDRFIAAVRGQSVLFGDAADKSCSIVYSPLNGSGYVPVTRVLAEEGFTNVTLVEEQRLPDGNFPTCPYPNPEIREAMALGMEYASRTGADLLLATDPDCDRVGIAVRNEAGEYVLLTGNQTGVLLLDYICSQRAKHGRMPQDPVLIKTIVSTDLADRVAASYGVSAINVLTGFKYIGEQVLGLEQQGREDRYIFGFEESYGYLSGSYVRDKDAVDASMLICEMFSFYKAQGVSLLQRLEQIYEKHGYCLNTLYSFAFEGAAGFEKMQSIMAMFRTQVGPAEGGNAAMIESLGGLAIETLQDYSQGLNGLPKADVLKYLLAGGSAVVVRPSGTEPKLKTYISVSAPAKEEALKIEAAIAAQLKSLIG